MDIHAMVLYATIASGAGALWGIFTHFNRAQRENIEWRAHADSKLDGIDPLWKPQISARVDAVERQSQQVESRMSTRVQELEGRVTRHLDRLEQRFSRENNQVLAQLKSIDEKLDGVLQQVPVLANRVDYLERDREHQH